MSEPDDPKEPEPVHVPAQPPMDMRADIPDPFEEDAPIQGKHFSWNERPHFEPVEPTPKPEQSNSPGKTNKKSL